MALSGCPALADYYNSGDDVMSCPVHTLSEAGATSLSQCTVAAGYYGVAGKAAPTACPVGTLSEAGATSLSQCTVAAGYYGVVVGAWDACMSYPCLHGAT